MRFNAAKCNIMRVSRTRDPKFFNYSLTGQVLEEVMDAKYLGVTLSNDLEWSKHIATITNKANSKLSFLSRNLKGCPEKLKQTAYFSLIRSFMEYGATVWDPYQKYNSDKIERVQRVKLQGLSRVGTRDTLVFLICLMCWGGRLFLKEDRRLDLFCFTKLLSVWHKCPSKASLPRRIRVYTRRKHNMKFRQIGHTTSQYGQSFFPKTISAWNGLAFAEAPSLAVFRSNFI